MNEGAILLLVSLILLFALVVVPALAILALKRTSDLGKQLENHRWTIEHLRRALEDLRAAAAGRPRETPAAPATPLTPEPKATLGPAARPAAKELGTSPDPWSLTTSPEPEAPASTLGSPPSPEVPEPPPGPEPAPAVQAARLDADAKAFREAASVSVEENLGVRLPVWIGAIALALAAVFLVKYSFDKGLITPAMRLVIGALFGAACLVVGEWIRARASYVAQGLSAAGIAILFAVDLASVNTYELVDPRIGFGFAVLIAGTAVLLSLRHGPLVATVGLAGGFLMPAWLHTGEPRPGALFSYLFLLEAGLVSVSIRRGWWWIAALNLLASFAWAAIWIAGVTHGILPVAHGLWVGLFLVASMTTFSIASGFARTTAHPATLAWSVDRALPTLAVVGGLVLLGFLSAATKFSTREWGFIAIVGTSLLVLARLDHRKEVLAVLGALSGAILLAVWHLRGVPPADETRFAWIALAFGILYAGGSYVAISGSARRGFWAGISALAGLAYFLVAYWDMERLPGLISWGTAAFLASSLYTLGALPFARRLELRPELRAPLAALTVAATAFITLAIPMELERQWITVAWALEVAALAWFEARLAARAIRVVIAILAAFVAVRLLINPAVLVYPVGTSPILNWILYGYGIPLVAFVLAARILRRRGEDALVRGLECCAIALGFVLIALLVRQYFHPGNLRASSVYLAEWATLVSIWTLYARQLSVLNGEGNRPSLRMGSLGVGIVAGVLGFLVLVFFENPLWARHPVGARLIWNGILFAYGFPLACAFLYLRELKRTKLKPVAILFAVHGIIFLFVLSSLEVRQAFHGSILAGPAPTNAEWYAYSVAWIALGTLLLVWGVVTGSHPARYASLVVMLLAVGKVFLFDTRELRDLYRVLSFLGLGLSLLFLAYIYQRFVFRRHER